MKLELKGGQLFGYEKCPLQIMLGRREKSFQTAEYRTTKASQVMEKNTQL